MSHHLNRMSDSGRMVLLVIACVGIGSGLCFVAGMLANLISEARSLHAVAPLLVVLIVVGALAASAWSFIKLVNWLYRRTY